MASLSLSLSLRNNPEGEEETLKGRFLFSLYRNRKPVSRFCISPKRGPGTGDVFGDCHASKLTNLRARNQIRN
jgi:hypothetical protein